MTKKLNDNEITKLYTQASDDMPSLELDGAILASAHKAVSAKPMLLKPKRSFMQHWQLPIGIAATVVLSASLTSVMLYEKPEVMTQPTAISSTNNASTMAKAAPMPLPISDNSPTESERASEDSASVSSDTNINEAPLGESLDKAISQKKMSEDIAAPQQSPKRDIDSKPAELAKPLVDEEAPLAAVQSPALSTSAPTAKSEIAAAAPAVVAEKKDSTINQEKNRLARKKNLDMPADATAQASIDTIQQTPPESSPETWLNTINELRKTGKPDIAKQSLKAFKIRYPDYALPKDLIEFAASN